MPIDVKRVQQVFLAAVEASDPAVRETILARECATDAELRERVADLLSHHDDGHEFLERPAAAANFAIEVAPNGSAPQSADLPEDFADALDPAAGTIIGRRYRLIEPIGEGGMGTVWLSEQLTPIQRNVALKLIRCDVAFQSALARTEAERQALALMDHPHIANVLDGGTTDDGSPYLVMELVEGIPITDYCDERQRTIAARLELFIQVCHAVQHAHQKGIIHRDIKPTNILVTEQNDKAAVKVIDFGLAKAVPGGPDLTDRPAYTMFGTMVGSPLYMAPEQVSGNTADVDTRTDVYALGVILFELLTGSTPIERRRLKETPWDEIYRLIRDEEPPRPSSRIMTSPKQADIAAYRQIEPERLRKLLDGDLNWIVLKALEKDPNRRYATANGLAVDIRHYLSQEPVSARPATSLYRLQKMVRRNRMAIAAAAAVAAALVIGLAVSTWLLIEERAAHERAVVAEQQQAELRQQAEAASRNEEELRLQAEENVARTQTETLRSQKVAEFMKAMFKGAGPKVALHRDTQLLREMMDETAEHLKVLQDQPAVEADLRATLGSVYADLGEYERAAEMHTAALALRRALPGDQRADIASSLNDLAEVLYGQGRFHEAETMHRDALAMRRQLFGDEHLSVAESLGNLGEAIRRERRPEKYAEVEAMLREALAIRRQLLGPENPEVATSLNNLGLILWHEAILGRARYDDAEAAHREALAMRRKLLGPNHPDVAMSLDRLGLTLHWASRYVEAEAIHREALAIRREVLGNEHPDVAHSLLNLANTLQHQNKMKEVEPLFREALAIRRKVLPAGHYDLTATIGMLVSTLLTGPDARSHDPQEAIALAKELLDLAPDDPGHLNSLGEAYYRAGDYQAAQAALEQAIKLRKRENNPFDAAFMAMTCWQLGDQEQAHAWYKKITPRPKKRQATDFALERVRAEAGELLGKPAQQE